MAEDSNYRFSMSTSIPAAKHSSQNWANRVNHRNGFSNSIGRLPSFRVTPERSARISKVRPPLHQYIRKLLFSDLDKFSIENVLRQLRKIPWSECEEYLLKCFLKVHKGKYSQIHLIASLTAGLSQYHEDFAISVVDEVLEEIRLGLELNDYGMQQKRVA